MMTEAEKILPLVLERLERKRVIDLGCGEKKIVPWAVGVDDCSESTIAKPDIIARVGATDKEALTGKLTALGLPSLGGWPVVFSSHTIEHLREPVGENLWWWWSLVARKGLFILCVPDESMYVYAPGAPKARNPAHKHLLTMEVMRWHLEQVTGANILSCSRKEYSVLFIVEKA